MRTLVVALLVLWAVPTSAAPPTKINFGDKWTSADGRKHEARLEIEWIDYAEQQNRFLRDPLINLKKSKVNGRRYPIESGEPNDGMANLDVTFDIDAKGVIKACATKKNGYYPKQEAEFCKFALSNIVFHPALSHDGKPVSAQGRFSATFKTDTSIYTIVTTNEGVVIENKNVEAKVIGNLSLDSLGLSKYASLVKKTKPVMFLWINQKGSVRDCDFFVPTFDDKFDAAVCDSAMKQLFVPGLDSEGRPREDIFILEFKP